MPRIERRVLSSVFYLFGFDKKEKKSVGPDGTGCIVARRSTQLDGACHYYGISNIHVVKDSHLIRVNTIDGRCRFLDISKDQWLIKDRFDDIAAVDLTDELDFDSDDISAVPEVLFSKNSDFSDKLTGLGDEAFMVGMFADETGNRRNMPKIRFGNISSIADDVETIEQGNSLWRPSHLVDMRSRSGFSGSPVFSYRPPDELWPSDPPWSLDINYPNIVTDYACFRLLGIHSMQYWEKVEYYKLPEKAEARGDYIREGDHLMVASSMTVVVPAWRISELLDEPELERGREARDRERRAEWLRRPRPETAG